MAQTPNEEFAVFTPGKLSPDFAAYQQVFEEFARCLSVKVGAGASGADSVKPGPAGASAYEVAVANGFTGTEPQWLASLIGDDGENARELVRTPMTGTIELENGALTHTYQAAEGVVPQSVRFWLQNSSGVYISQLGFSGQLVTISFSAAVADSAVLGYYYEIFDYAEEMS